MSDTFELAQCGVCAVPFGFSPSRVPRLEAGDVPVCSYCVTGAGDLVAERGLDRPSFCDELDSLGFDFDDFADDGEEDFDEEDLFEALDDEQSGEEIDEGEEDEEDFCEDVDDCDSVPYDDEY